MFSMTSRLCRIGFWMALVLVSALPTAASGRAETVDYTYEALLEQLLEDEISYPVTFSDDEWRERLSDQEYAVLRRGRTEYAFTGEYEDFYERGTYHSRATGQPLFSSEHKYDSYTGWPSYWQPIDPDAVLYKPDSSYGVLTIEVVDSLSGSHLGHVFPDGPEPTGLRYCINSAALIFVPHGAEPPPIVQEYMSRFANSER